MLRRERFYALRLRTTSFVIPAQAGIYFQGSTLCKWMPGRSPHDSDFVMLRRQPKHLLVDNLLTLTDRFLIAGALQNNIIGY